jgi:hypothetical protein
VIGGKGREGLAQEKRERDGHGRQRAAVAGREQHPAIEEGGKAAIGLTNENVLAAGFRKHAAQFRARQPREQRDRARDHPQQEREARIGHSVQHVGRRDEDGGSDRAADHQHDRIEQGEAAYECVNSHIRAPRDPAPA